MAKEKMPAISQHIWDTKYRLRHGDKIIDKTIEDTWHRVAKAVAQNESDPALYETVFYKLLEDFKFLPAGRITSNAGSDRSSVTMLNCFLSGTIEDSMAGIYRAVAESAATQKQGGGIGFDFSTIRPKGVGVKGVGASASGPVSFMQVFDASCKTIMSAG